jgi:hypothetical protein
MDAVAARRNGVDRMMAPSRKATQWWRELPSGTPEKQVAALALGRPGAHHRCVTETPLVAGPLYGLRTWVVAGEPGAERLAGPQSGAPWPDGGAWLHAACARDAAHRAPAHDCVCGVHALHPDAHNARRVLASRREVAGIVECHGAVEVHAEGFRAARGRPHALVVTPMRNAALAGRLARAYGAEVVEVHGPAELADWCRERGLGLDATVVDGLLGPGATARSRRERRRRTRRLVAGLTAWLVGSVILALIAAAALPDPEGPHDVFGRAGHFHIP